MPRPVRRRLQRKWRQPLAGLALLLALGPAPALAATINVDGINCTLVDAITAANIDNAIGLCTAGSGPDTLVLTAGSTHTLTTVNNSTPYGDTGLPVITSAITIAGNNSTIARSQVTGTPDFRLLVAGSTGDLTLHGLALAGGALDSSIGGNVGAGVLNRGILTLINSSVRGNSAASGSGVFNNGTVILANSSLSGNTASDNGGGIFSNGTVVLTNSAISDSTAGDNGGGVFTNGPLTLTSSTISGNTASLAGGGGVASNGVVTLTNSIVSGNTAGVFGGGVVSSTLSLINSTVSGNSAGARDGGVSTSNLTIARTLISGNTAPAGSEIRATSTVASDGFNLVGHSGLTTAQAIFGFTPGVTDITATSDGTTPTALAFIINPILANNGGLTQTHALPSGSPAIDAVTAGCPPPNRDQRGVPRPQDGDNDTVAQCDIGAFERVRPGTVTCDGLPATKVGTRASQILTGTSGPDVIQGLGGNDVIQGLAGNDVICGGPGNDRLLAGRGSDRLFGGASIDRMNGVLGFDRCNGGPPATGDTAVNCEQLSNVP